MHGAETDTITDATIGAIAARAARYPVIEKSSQMRVIRKETAEPGPGDQGIRWLLLNTWATNRFLEETGWSELHKEFATNRCLKGTG